VDAYLTALLQEGPSGPAALGLARSYLALGDFELAGQFLESLRTSEPGSKEARLLLGLVRYRQGQDAAAIRLWSRPDDPCQLIPECLPLQECLGECHYRRGDFLQAIQSWLPLLDHPAFAERTLVRLGRAFFHLGRPASALVFFRHAVKFKPRNLSALNNGGDAPP
jgi:tetratricopeptide (TPR) repeat protein